MIKTIDRILTNDELEYLLSKCDSFIKNNETIPDGKSWFYNSMHLYDDYNLHNLRLKLLEVVGDKYNIQYNGIFINKIIPETNTNDGYHVDSSDLSIVMFLNDNFDGGEFEYYETPKTLKKIKPSIDKCILLDKEVLHRVLPIQNGVRYTLIVWFKMVKKVLV